MHPQCSWVMLIGISAHCAKLTQDIPGPALPDSTCRTVKLCRMFSSHPRALEGCRAQRIEKAKWGEIFCFVFFCIFPDTMATVFKYQHLGWKRSGCTFELSIRLAFPPWIEGVEGLKIHKSSCKDEYTPVLPPDSVRSSLTTGFCTLNW